MTNSISEEGGHRAIRQVMHPAISRSLVDLGMAKDITMESGKVTLNHWIEHNKKHSQEFREWAEKARGLGEAETCVDILETMQ